MGQVVRDSDEWTAMWRGLASGYDIDATDEETGESWQYMGSHDEGYGWQHSFRHRSLQGQRLCVNVGASAGWAPVSFTEFDLDTMPF
jgi:hypothetical protein